MIETIITARMMMRPTGMNMASQKPVVKLTLLRERDILL